MRGYISGILECLVRVTQEGLSDNCNLILLNRLTLWANEQEICQHLILFDTNTNKMAAAFRDFYGKLL